MAEFRVRWTIDLDADSLIGAAQRAQEIQRNPESMASLFEVKLFGGKRWHTIDLLSEEELAKGYKPPAQPERGTWRK